MANSLNLKIIFMFVCLFYVVNSQQCDLSKIWEQRNFDESKFWGLWYEVRWYLEPLQKIERELWDLSFIVQQHPSKPDTIDYTLNAREKAVLDDKCLDTWKDERIRIRPGYYDFTNSTLRKAGEAWIVYIDYDNFMVEFLCFEKQGNICTRPEVGFWSRTKKARKQDLRKGQELIKDLCVNPKRFLDKLQAVDCVTPPRGAKRPDDGCPSSRSRYCDRTWGPRCSRWRHYLYNCRSRYSCRRYRYFLNLCQDYWDDCYHY